MYVWEGQLSAAWLSLRTGSIGLSCRSKSSCEAKSSGAGGLGVLLRIIQGALSRLLSQSPRRATSGGGSLKLSQRPEGRWAVSGWWPCPNGYCGTVVKSFRRVISTAFFKGNYASCIDSLAAGDSSLSRAPPAGADHPRHVD